MILALVVFVFISLVVLVGLFIWSRYFSARSKAMRQRIQELARQRNPAETEAVSLKDDPLAFLYENFSETFWYKHLSLLCIQAGSQRNADKIIQVSVLIFLLAFILSLLFGPGFFSCLLIALIFASLPTVKLIRERDKRCQKFEQQLPDALEFLSRALLSGNGIASAFTMVGDEFSAPLGEEFKMTSEQLNYGLPFAEALNQLNARVISRDLGFFTVSLSIQRDTGGNLADILNITANTIRERMKLKGKVEVLASEAKLSAKLLTSLPFILGGILALTNYNYISLIWTTPQGYNLMGTACVLIPLGWIWMGKIVNIKV